ncbi:gastrokine-1 [Nothoprocta perdicaria]|uniref:gastrokine-1 n=1 Tax=Nothoprocta perdicaria TaxID=30464 RepID=UPI000E1BDAD0|nr:gastrokine-1 [Nothoprocta perdicaria]
MIVIIALGLLLTPSLAGKNEKRNKEISIDKNAQETVYINKAEGTAYIDINDGRKSWNLVWNYRSGYLASRSFENKVCFISKINKDLMPDVVAFAKKGIKDQRAPPKEVTQIISKRKIRDLKAYGESVYALCKGLPTYTTYETHGHVFASQRKPKPPQQPRNPQNEQAPTKPT